MANRRSRGAYRGVFSALIDDPDFQKLSPDARLTLLVARVCRDAGPSAIFRYYPDKLAEQTGLPRTALTMALAELADAGWIEEDGVILWVRNGLRYDPHVSLANLNHRESIGEHLEALPKRDIVLRFCEYYGFDNPFTSHVTSLVTTGSREREKGVGNGSREPERERDSASALAETVAGGGRGAKTASTWEAYVQAYTERYGTEPVRNAKINGMLTYFVRRVPRGEAPAVAAYYVHSNFGLYVRAGHPVDLLLRDAEKLRTEWATGRQMTELQAREADRLKGTGDQYQQVIEHYEREAQHGRSKQG